MNHVCLECGAAWTTREALENHWAANRHGPETVDADAIDRARWSLTGEGSYPSALDTDLAGDETSPPTATVQRRRMRLVRGGRR